MFSRVCFLFLSVLFTALVPCVAAQAQVITDSLLKELKMMPDDSTKVKLLCRLCSVFSLSHPEDAIAYGEEGIQLSEKINFQLGKAICLHEMGVVHYYQGQYDKSLKNYIASVIILEKMTDDTLYAAHSIAAKLLADDLHDMGKVYYRQRQYSTALDTYRKSLRIYKLLDYKPGIATCLNNIGGIYDARKDIDSTLFFLKESLKITEEIGDKKGIATRVNNIGLMYKMKKNYGEALDYLSRALKIREEMNDAKGLAYSYTDIGTFYIDIKNYHLALFYLYKGLEYAQETGVKERIIASYEALSLTHAQLKQYNKAYEYHLLLSELKDSLFNEEAGKKIAEMSAKYESEKKQREIELLQKDKELSASELQKKEAEAKRENIQKLAFAGGFGLMLVLALVILSSYKQKQKMNFILAEKNKDITDSIEYAKRIQDSMLPDEKEFRNLFPDSFVLFKPRDIVSGDFYWTTQISGTTGCRYLLVADCTGHGVPGALMSMMGTTLYNEVVNDKNVLLPNLIFDEVRMGLIKSLRQKGKEGEQKDGMDAVICRFIQKEDGNVKLECACAKNPVLIFRTREGGNASSHFQIEPDRHPVGTYLEENPPFTLHTATLEKGDCIYLFTDGYADQFGGEKGKKFKYSKLKELFISMQDKSMNEQKEILIKTFKNWIGNEQQVDDICVCGVRV